MTTHHHAGQPHSAVHGMLVVGDSTVLLSHLPMFMSPHDFQAIFEVTLREAGQDPLAVYREDRKRSGERLYTWVPAPFVLQTLFDAPAQPRAMHGTIVRGHFERGGEPITSEKVEAAVTRVLHSRQFDPSAAALPHLQYFLIGSPAEPFLAHVITRPPDFDHVVSVTLAQPPVGWKGEALALEFPERKNTLDARVKEGEALEGVIVSKPDARVRMKVVREFYKESGDLEE